ncbi:MAG: DsbA family protein [Candidatus Korobacteraceae bacterium]
MRNVGKYAAIYAAVLLMSISLIAENGAKSSATKSAGVAQAQSAGGPSRELTEAYFKRLFGYDSAIDVKVLNIAPSPIAELSEVSVLFVTPDGQQAGKWYVSNDLKHVIAGGEMLPFGADPFAEVRAKLASSVSGPSKGPADAKMLIVEFADLECPACKEAAPVMDRLREDFPQARFVFQSFPLPQHPWAMKAASYLDCIGRANQDQAFTFLDAVFTHQKEIEDAVRKTDAAGKTTIDDVAVVERLRQYTTMAGADAAKVEACAATPETSERITRSQLLGKDVGVNSTPTLFLNGRRVGNPRADQYDALKGLAGYEAEQAAK